jgi:hypothetical protein
MKKYKNKYTNEEHSFSYFWSYSPYFAGENFLKICLVIEPSENNVMSNLVEGSTPNVIYKDLADYPELHDKIMALASLKYINAVEVDAFVGTYGFTCPNEADFKRKIDIISAFLREIDVQFAGKVDRLSGLPSYKYADDLISHVFGDEFTTLVELEDYIANKCKARTPLKELMEGFCELPLDSDVKFNPYADTPTSAIDDRLREMMLKVQEKVKESKLIRAEAQAKQANVATTETVSNEYQSFGSMWL